MSNNIIDEVISRIEDYRKENKNPCKNYATKESAEKATLKVAKDTATCLNREGKVVPYFVVFNESWSRWVGIIDTTRFQLMEKCGGYIAYPCSKGFYSI